MLILNYSLLYTTESEEEEPDSNEKMAANEDEAMNEDPAPALEEDTTGPVANAKSDDQTEDTEVAAAAPGKSTFVLFYLAYVI